VKTEPITKKRLVYCLQVRPEPDLGSKVLSGIDACIAPLSLSA